MNRLLVFLDANILFSWNLNHLFMFFSDLKAGLLQPYWSDEVIAEAVKNIMARERADDASKVEARFIKMNEAFPYACVIDYQEIPDIGGVDPKDQHVAKAALQSECKYLVTENTSDFIKGNFNGSLKVVTPDTLLAALGKTYPAESLLITALAWWHKTNGAGTFEEYLEFLERETGGVGLINFVTGLRKHILSQSQTPSSISTVILKNETRRY